MEQSSNKDKSKFIFSICVICLFLVLIIGVTFIKPVINFSDYVSVEISGYNGIGTASVEVDEFTIYLGFSDTLKWNESKYKKAVKRGKIDELSQDILDSDPVEYIVSVLNNSITLSKDTGLSNEDVITLSFDIDKTYINALQNITGCYIKYEDIEIVVDGLTEAEIADPYAGIDVSFSGADGYGVVSIEIGDGAYSLVSYNADKSSGLSNGDTVTITASCSQDSVYSNYGFVFSEGEKEYIVEGLPELISSFDNLSDDGTEQVEAAAEALVLSELGSDPEIIYLGRVLATDYDTGGNEMYLLYAADYGDFTGYTYAVFDDIGEENGNISYVGCSVADAIYMKGLLIYSGYEDLEDILLKFEEMEEDGLGCERDLDTATIEKLLSSEEDDDESYASDDLFEDFGMSDEELEQKLSEYENMFSEFASEIEQALNEWMENYS